jgi:hypothetical protein
VARENKEIGTNVAIFVLDHNVLLFDPIKYQINQDKLDSRGKIIWADNLKNIETRCNFNFYHFFEVCIYKYNNVSNNIDVIELITGMGMCHTTNNVIFIKSDRALTFNNIISNKFPRYYTIFKKTIVNNRELINHLPNSWKQLIVENF